MAPSPNLRGSRRELALVFTDGPRTAHEVSKALGRPTGSFYGVLKRMHAEGLLLADTDIPTRGTQYRLAAGARDALREADERTAAGHVQHGQQFLLVEPPADPVAAQRVLSRDAVSGSVVWAAEVGGGWLLALDPDVPGSHPLQRLQLALAAAGAPSRQLHVTGLIDGQTMRNRASWLLEELAGAAAIVPFESRS